MSFEGNTVSLLFQNRCKLEGFTNLIFSGTRIAFLYSILFQKGRGTRKILNNFHKALRRQKLAYLSGCYSLSVVPPLEWNTFKKRMLSPECVVLQLWLHSKQTILNV